MSEEFTSAQLAEWLESLHRLEGHSKEVQERLRELDEARRALGLIAAYFRSGNDVPVERATLRADSEAVKSVFAVLDGT